MPDDLPLKNAVRERLKSGRIQSDIAYDPSSHETVQISQVAEMKREIVEFVQNGSTVNPAAQLRVQGTVAVVKRFSAHLRQLCISNNIPQAYGIAVGVVVLTELDYSQNMIQFICGYRRAVMVEAVNAYGWVVPDEVVLDGIHSFFVDISSGSRINPPLTDLRHEKKRHSAYGMSGKYIVPMPPLEIMGVMRGLRAAMDISPEFSTEHEAAKRVLTMLTGLAVRRGAAMLTLGWGMNVHHNTVKKYAENSCVQVYSIGIPGAPAHQQYTALQQHMTDKTIPGTSFETDEYVYDIVNEDLTLGLLLDSLAPSKEDESLTKRPTAQIIFNGRGALLSSPAQLDSARAEMWRTRVQETALMSRYRADAVTGARLADGHGAIVPVARFDDSRSLCPTELALISSVGAHERYADEYLRSSERRRTWLPAVPLASIVHLVPGSTVDDAKKYCEDVIEYLKTSDVDEPLHAGDDLPFDGEDSTEVRRERVEMRTEALEAYTPPKYRHLVNPETYDEDSLVWAALCNPNKLTRVWESTESVEEFDKAIPSLGVVNSSGKIRPPRQRKGGPYARR